MLHKILRVFLSAVGFIIGPGIVLAAQSAYGYFSGAELPWPQPWAAPLAYVASGVVSGVIFIFLSGPIAGAIEKGISRLEGALTAGSSVSLLAGAVGLIIGLVVAALISVIIGLIPLAWITVPLTIIDYIIFGYLGVSIGIKRRAELIGFFTARRARSEGKTDSVITPKILDTSVIIDGRIFDICKTGMFEGEILIPEFVLAELQRIADSPGDLKRARGRRGLDILGKMQRELKVPVRVTDKDYDDVAEVDAKLIRLARDVGGKVVTNDYNLNKVAAVQGVEVFNVNELANAVKPVLTAGEDVTVTIVKDGKEPHQGVAYLDDGTMIVVEGGKSREGQSVTVTVTSVLQTAAGRMVFAKLRTL